VVFSSSGFRPRREAPGISSSVRKIAFKESSCSNFSYQAIIQPHFDYCNVVWGNCGITVQNKVQKLQNRAAHVLTYSNYDADAGYLFELL